MTIKRYPQTDMLLLAERVIEKTYGDKVSVFQKAKNLNKFGRNITVGTSFETIAELQGTTGNETFVTTNLIDSIVSDSASDSTQTIVVEGHTIDGSGNLTFVSQEAALNGQTEVTLSTPMARANRMYVKPTGTFGSEPAALVGNVYVYDNTAGTTAGAPNTAAATKVMIVAGETQSEKAATSVSQGDYWLISYFGAGIGNAGASANIVTVRMETRDVRNGGAWRPLGADIPIVIGQQNPAPFQFDPFLIVPKNHDWRIVGKTDTNTAEISAEAGGYLAAII